MDRVRIPPIAIFELNKFSLEKLAGSLISCPNWPVRSGFNNYALSSKLLWEPAVTTLWTMCYLFPDRKAQEAVMATNGLTKILWLMQSNYSPTLHPMCVDLLKIFQVNSKSCLPCYDTKTTHIMLSWCSRWKARSGHVNQRKFSQWGKKQKKIHLEKFFLLISSLLVLHSESKCDEILNHSLNLD